MVGGGRILVMAGAREAHGLIAGLLSRGRDVIAALPEPERGFDPLPVPTRVGTFDTSADFADWIEAREVTCVIDASHAFEGALAQQTAHICARRDLRYLRVLRPAWRASRSDRWTSYPSVRAAARDVPERARVFSNTGRASLPELADFSGGVLFLRQTAPQDTPPPFAFVTYVMGTPPYSQFEEEALFRDLDVSLLICRNVGGAASMSKLLAARRLGIRVAMVDRPDPPVGMPRMETVAEALAWEANG